MPNARRRRWAGGQVRRPGVSRAGAAGARQTPAAPGRGRQKSPSPRGQSRGRRARGPAPGPMNLQGARAVAQPAFAFASCPWRDLRCWAVAPSLKGFGMSAGRGGAAQLARPAVAGRRQGVAVVLDDLQGGVEPLLGVVVAQLVLSVEALELLAQFGALLVGQGDGERLAGELVELGR
jgi:hypothetical protein